MADGYRDDWRQYYRDLDFSQGQGTGFGSSSQNRDNTYYRIDSDYVDFAEQMRDEQQREQELRERQFRVRTFRSRRYDEVGHFVLPETAPKSKYADHYYIFEEPRYDIDFNTSYYPLFDGEIAKQLQRAGKKHNGLTNPKNKQWDSYEPLRQNISILRNVIYSEMFADGEFNPGDPNDQRRKEYIRQIGTEVGKNLLGQSDASTIRRNFMNIVTLGAYSLANPVHGANSWLGRYADEHIGAAELYRALIKVQNAPTLNPLRWLQGKFRRYDWGLDPVEESPFSAENIKQAFINDEDDRRIGLSNPAEKLKTQAFLLDQMAAKLSHVEDMQPAEIRTSINLGHHILDNLRRVRAGNAIIEKDQLLPARDRLKESELLVELGLTYMDVIAQQAQQDPNYRNSNEYQNDRLILAKLGQITMLNAINAAANSGDEGQIGEITAAIKKLPDEFTTIDRKLSIDRVIDYMEMRLQEASNRVSGQRLSEIKLDEATEKLLYDNLYTIANESASITSSSKSAVQIAQMINEENRRTARRAATQQQRRAMNNVNQQHNEEDVRHSRVPQDMRGGQVPQSMRGGPLPDDFRQPKNKGPLIG